MGPGPVSRVVDDLPGPGKQPRVSPGTEDRLVEGPRLEWRGSAGSLIRGVCSRCAESHGPKVRPDAPIIKATAARPSGQLSVRRRGTADVGNCSSAGA